MVGAGRAALAADPGRTVVKFLAETAAWYGRRGLHVHPLRPGGKLPRLERWQERATTEPRVIADWWSRWPDAGVGIATGAASGVVVVDVDPRHEGDESLRDLEREHGETPATWRCLTAGGGLHIYFRHPGGRIANRVGLWPGIDLRGDGGYVVAPPTELGTGRAYSWEIGAGPHEVALADAPGWLLARIRAEQSDGEARPADEWAALVRGPIAAGARNDSMARLAGYLLRRRPAPRVVLELLRTVNESRCRPPLPDEEITRTVDSIARREAERRRE